MPEQPRDFAGSLSDACMAGWRAKRFVLRKAKGSPKAWKRKGSLRALRCRQQKSQHAGLWVAKGAGVHGKGRPPRPLRRKLAVEAEGAAGGELQSQSRAKITLRPDLPFQGGLVGLQLLLGCPFLKEFTPHLLNLQSTKEKEKVRAGKNHTCQ